MKVNNPSDPDLKKYLDQNGIVVNSDLLKSGKSKLILGSILGGTSFLALIIILLATIIVIMTFELIIRSSKESITLLRHLGYHSDDLKKYFNTRFYTLLIIEIGIVLLFLIPTLLYFSNYIKGMGYSDVSLISPITIFTFLICLGLNILFFKFSLNRALKS